MKVFLLAFSFISPAYRLIRTSGKEVSPSSLDMIGAILIQTIGSTNYRNTDALLK